MTSEVHTNLDPLGIARAPGLDVRVTDALVGTLNGSHVEVYPLGTGIDCKPIAREPEDLRTQYPAGATVTVVGMALAISGRQAPAITVVVTQADDLGHVARVPVDVPRRPDGSLDFRGFRESHHASSSAMDEAEASWADAHRSWFEDYEFLRCLFALEKRPPATVASEMLRSMAYYSRYGRMRPDLAMKSYRELLAASGVSRSQRRFLEREFRTVQRSLAEES